MRQAARTAWVRLDNSSRLRRAMLAKSTTQVGPRLPGEQVYFWKSSGMKPRGKPDPARWIGPAVVLSVAGSVVWLGYRQRLIKASAVNARSATADELMTPKFVLDELEHINTTVTPARGGRRSSWI